MILEYPWLEQFNPDINWENGKILGTPITMKTPAAITKERLQVLRPQRA